MKKKIFFFLVIFFSFLSDSIYSKDIYPTIQPEPFSKRLKLQDSKVGRFKNIIVLTANDYATNIGYDILKKGGTVADAAVAIQLVLGLVEPQSSGLGGGTFVTYFDKKTNKTISFEGREKAPQKLKQNLFLTQEGEPKKFFEAVVGGSSVGVPATLNVLYKIHSQFGNLPWKEVIDPVIKFSRQGFVPSNRLKNALKKEKFLFEINPSTIFKNIIKNPEKKFFNHQYTKTLKKISEDYNDFYKANIAEDIVSVINNSINPGKMSIKDMKSYDSVKKNALCKRLNSNFEICGPNLPSSGTICVIQGLILFEEIFSKELESNSNFVPDLNVILDILNFVYVLREKYLADPDYVYIDKKKLLEKDFLLRNYKSFNSNHSSDLTNIDEVFSSTTHFSMVDKFKNVLSATSSIESSFGSRLYTNGFFLNNQLTDFSFSNRDVHGRLIKNRPSPGKRPLSSMAPLIVFDKNKNFFLTIGSPGGKAIISYVLKALISILYNNVDIKESIESPNYIRIKGKTYIEKEILNKNLKIPGVKRNLTSGLGIIKKEDGGFVGAADSRRDGTVRGN